MAIIFIQIVKSGLEVDITPERKNGDGIKKIESIFFLTIFCAEVKSVDGSPLDYVEELDKEEQGGVASSTATEPGHVHGSFPLNSVDEEEQGGVASTGSGHVQEIAMNRAAKKELGDVKLTWKWSRCNSRSQRRLVLPV